MIHEIYNENKREFDCLLFFRSRNGYVTFFNDADEIAMRLGKRVSRNSGVVFLELTGREMVELMIVLDVKFCVIMNVINDIMIMNDER